MGQIIVVAQSKIVISLLLAPRALTSIGKCAFLQAKSGSHNSFIDVLHPKYSVPAIFLLSGWRWSNAFIALMIHGFICPHHFRKALFFFSWTSFIGEWFLLPNFLNLFRNNPKSILQLVSSQMGSSTQLSKFFLEKKLKIKPYNKFHRKWFLLPNFLNFLKNDPKSTLQQVSLQMISSTQLSKFLKEWTQNQLYNKFHHKWFFFYPNF
jgi:hypothetical protein